MKFAFINDNQVKKIEELEEDQAFSEAIHFQQIIQIDSLVPEPKVGWLWENGKLVPNIPDATPRQIRQALILSGVSIDMITAALDSLPEPTRSLAKVEWEYSIAFKRNRQLVIQVGLMLGWTPEQLDDLWKLALSL